MTERKHYTREFKFEVDSLGMKSDFSPLSSPLTGGTAKLFTGRSHFYV